jgi:hypothetical protein
VSKVSSTVSKAADDSFVSSTFDEPDVKADDLHNVLVKQNCELYDDEKKKSKVTADDIVVPDERQKRAERKQIRRRDAFGI